MLNLKHKLLVLSVLKPYAHYHPQLETANKFYEVWKCVLLLEDLLQWFVKGGHSGVNINSNHFDALCKIKPLLKVMPKNPLISGIPDSLSAVLMELKMQNSYEI